MPPSTTSDSSATTSTPHSSSIYPTPAAALEAATQRYIARNPVSRKLHEEAAKSLPGGNTRSILHNAPFPVCMKRGEEYKVISEDGHVYTDLTADLTAGLYGHTHPLLTQTISHTLSTRGLNLGPTTTLESQYARLLCTRFNLSQVRFTNSGTEATLHALQGARKFTGGRRKVVVFNGGYHGAVYYFANGKPVENCVDVEDWIVGRYNDVEDAQEKIERSGDVAAVLVEGMQGASGCIPGSREFLLQCQDSAGKVGAVFILDEVMTSRLAPGGLQEILGLNPDITTLGKYLGGGITFGAFGGKEEVMRVYDPRAPNSLAHSGTFNNNTLGMAAGFAGLNQVYTPDVCVQFNELGDRFRGMLLEISRETKMTVTGRGTVMAVHFLRDGGKNINRVEDMDEDVELRDLFWLEMMEEGFWITRRGMLALVLGTPFEEITRFVECAKAFLAKYKAFLRV